MKSFKVLDGKVIIDGVTYSPTPTESNIIGKSGGRIHSINIPAKGQFFPISGIFNDGTTPIVDEVLEPVKKKKAKATKLVEENGKALDDNGNPIKKKSSKKK